MKELKYDEATAEFQKVVKIRGGNLSQHQIVGYLYTVSGKQAEARQVLQELLRALKDRYVSPCAIAFIYTALGEKDKAFDWLEEGLNARDNGMSMLKIDERFDALRSDPRFAQLLKEIGLPQ